MTAIDPRPALEPDDEPTAVIPMVRPRFGLGPVPPAVPAARVPAEPVPPVAD